MVSAWSVIKERNQIKKNNSIDQIKADVWEILSDLKIYNENTEKRGDRLWISDRRWLP